MLVLLLALFGFAVELLDAEPRSGSVIRLALFEQPAVPGTLVLGTWLVEASGLIALFLLTQGRFGTWWLDGLVAGWVAWIFRGPLLVVTIVVAARQPQDPWWSLAFGWWVLYSVCGLSLAVLARRSGLEPWARPVGEPSEDEVESPDASEAQEATSAEPADDGPPEADAEAPAEEAGAAATEAAAPAEEPPETPVSELVRTDEADPEPARPEGSTDPPPVAETTGTRKDAGSE